MNNEILISVTAVALSLFSIAWSVLSSFRTSRESAVASSFSLMAQAEALLLDVPSALKFHSITEQDLEDAGLSPKEFVYLLVNFTSAGVLYRMRQPGDSSPFPRGSYRYVMLESPDTRRAWPVLRKMVNPEIGAYGRKIEATIALIERDNGRNG